MIKTREHLCILISGRGSNLLSLIESCRRKNFPAKIKLVVSDNPKAPGLKYAKQYKIPFKVITKNFENTLLKTLDKHNIDIICLAGFMKILSKKFMKANNILVTRERHRAKLNAALKEIEKFLKKDQKKEIETAAEDLRLATRHLGSIVGKVDVEEILGSIFQDFCIGK